MEFGRSIRRLWGLDETATLLNHGSYGACPSEVLQEQDRIRREMERQPDVFFQRIFPTHPDSVLRAAAREVGAFVGVDGNRLAFIENATSGVQAVLQSMRFAAGDEILLTDHQYNAVQLAVEARCRETGASIRIARIPIPTTPDEVTARVLEAAGSNVKLAIIDHITSPTALVFPVEPIIAGLRGRGIPVLVDGAHVIGQLPLDIRALGADWYVSNAHKWLYAPKGSAIFHASEQVAAWTRPTVTSHFREMAFPRAFDYIGTRDYSAWLSVPAALAFFRRLGPARLHDHTAKLIRFASERLMSIGTQAVGPIEMCAAMRTFILPQGRTAVDQDASTLVRTLWEGERIQVKSDALFGQLLLRVSAQAYVDEEDFIRLSEVLDKLGWAGRE